MVSGTDIDKIYHIPSSFLSSSPTPISIFDKANHFLPRSFSDAPKGYLAFSRQRSAISNNITDDSWNAVSLFNTPESMETFCSVKAQGLARLSPKLEVANCDFKFCLSSSEICMINVVD
jgi:hypothetical protein